MLHTNFSTNWNHKLCCPCFGTIRLDDSYELNQEREIRLRNNVLGIAKVVAIRKFPYCQLHDNLAFVDGGHNARYMREVFFKMHGQLADHRLITWVILEWVTPDLTAMQQLFTDAWQKTTEKFTIAYRDTPESQQLQFALNF